MPLSSSGRVLSRSPHPPGDSSALLPRPASFLVLTSTGHVWDMGMIDVTAQPHTLEGPDEGWAWVSLGEPGRCCVQMSCCSMVSLSTSRNPGTAHAQVASGDVWRYSGICHQMKCLFGLLGMSKWDFPFLTQRPHLLKECSGVGRQPCLE